MTSKTTTYLTEDQKESRVPQMGMMIVLTVENTKMYITQNVLDNTLKKTTELILTHPTLLWQITIITSINPLLFSSHFGTHLTF